MNSPTVSTDPPAVARVAQPDGQGPDPMRSTARLGGILYLITFAASFPALALRHDFTNNVDFILGSGNDTRVLWSAVLELANALACVGTGVVLYRFGRRYSRTGAIGFVASRTLEAAIISTGIVMMFATVTMRRELSGALGSTGSSSAAAAATDPATLRVVGQAMEAIQQWTFLLGPGVMAGINALFLGTVMYRSGRIPRIIPTIGLIGVPLILASDVAVMLGVFDQLSPLSAVGAAPIALWELSLGLWLTFKGLQPGRYARS